MTKAQKNTLKARLKAGETTRGIWLNLQSDAVTEIAGHSGADWCVVDGEHAPFDPVTLQRQLRILEGTPANAAIRVPDDQTWMLKQVLDIGARTVIVPMVDTPDQAEAIVQACRYPPHGIRGMGPAVARVSGYGRLSDYASNANDEICIIVQAETGTALDNIEAIATVDGIDGIFIGPADMAANLGTGPKAVADAIDDAIRRIAATGLTAGILTTPDQRAHYEAQGTRMTGIASDARLMERAMAEVFA